LKETQNEETRQPAFEVVDIVEGGTSKDGNDVFVVMRTNTGDTVRCALKYSRLEKFQEGIRHLIRFVKKRRSVKGLEDRFEGAPTRPRKIVDACAGQRWSTDNIVLRFSLDDGGFGTFEIEDEHLDGLIATLTKLRNKKRRDAAHLRVVH